MRFCISCLIRNVLPVCLGPLRVVIYGVDREENSLLKRYLGIPPCFQAESVHQGLYNEMVSNIDYPDIIKDIFNNIGDIIKCQVKFFSVT